MSYRRGDELTVRIDAAAFEGKTIARHDGLVVFVEGGVPGDEVRVRLTKIKKQFLEAEVAEVIEPSPLRVRPLCKHFGTCGGCKWQNVGYRAQLDFKWRHVADALERIGKFANIPVNPTLGAEDIYYYRNKMEFSFGEKWLSTEEMALWKAAEKTGSSGVPSERFALGLHIPQRFDKVLDLEECYLQSETSNQILHFVRSFGLDRNLTACSTRTHTGYLRNLVIRQSAHTNELMVNLVTSEDRPEVMSPLTAGLLEKLPFITTIVNNITQRMSQVAIGEEEKIYHGSGFITEMIASRTYRISANSFFQTNTKQAERLYDVARRMAALKPDDVVFDLYSGTGTIALHIADDVREVVGIENVPSAVDDARRNAVANRVSNCVFVLGDLKEKLTRDTAWQSNHPSPTVMIIDPPRAGMHEKVVREVVQMRPERIVYVSCNPSTQARDLNLMCGEDAYRITEVQPVDMFPHTYHIENVVSLVRT